MKSHRTSTTAVTLTLTLVAVALILLGIWLLTPHSAPNASPAVSEPSQVHTPNRSAAGTASKDSSSTRDPAVLPEADIQEATRVSEEFLKAYYSQGYQDPSPNTWLDRVQTLSTPELMQHIREENTQEEESRPWRTIKETHAQMRLSPNPKIQVASTRAEGTAEVKFATVYSYEREAAQEDGKIPATKEYRMLVLQRLPSGDWKVTKFYRTVRGGH